MNGVNFLIETTVQSVILRNGQWCQKAGVSFFFLVLSCRTVSYNSRDNKAVDCKWLVLITLLTSVNFTIHFTISQFLVCKYCSLVYCICLWLLNNSYFFKFPKVHVRQILIYLSFFLYFNKTFTKKYIIPSPKDLILIYLLI